MRGKRRPKKTTRGGESRKKNEREGGLWKKHEVSSPTTNINESVGRGNGAGAIRGSAPYEQESSRLRGGIEEDVSPETDVVGGTQLSKRMMKVIF